MADLTADIRGQPVEPPRILVVPVCWRQPIGGSDLHLLAFARQLAAEGRFTVEIASAAPLGAEPQPASVGFARVSEFRSIRPSILSRAAARLIWMVPGLAKLAARSGWEPPSLASPDLIAHVRARAAAVQAVLTGPYRFRIPAAVIAAAPGKVALLACLHDEPFARLGAARTSLCGAAVVLFNTPPERALARRLHGPVAATGPVVGFGVEPPTAIAPLDRLRACCRIPGDYLVFIGRQHRSKGFNRLITLVGRYNRRWPGQAVTLVSIGAGSRLSRPPAWLHQLGVVDEAEKYGLLQGALANITLSRMESLSITLLEGWSVGTPAIVDRASEVLRWQVEESGGGYAISDERDLDDALAALRQPETRAEKARAGHAFLAARYDWHAVCERLIAALPGSAPSPP